MKRSTNRRTTPVPLRSSLILLASLAAAATPAAAIDITWGDVVVQNLGEYGFTANNSVLSFDDGTTDQLYQMYGYLGNANGVVAVNGNSFDISTPFPGSVTGNTVSSEIVLDNNGASTLNGLSALGLTAGDIGIRYDFELVNDTSTYDHDGFLWNVQITNNTAAALDLVFYSYLDLDLDGSGDYADDRATASHYQIRVWDDNSPTEYTWLASNGGYADHYEVQQYAGVRTKLNNMTAADDLADTPLPFGPGDFTAAFQYNVSVNAGQTINLGSNQIVPEPGTGTLLLMGLIGMALRRRTHTD